MILLHLFCIGAVDIERIAIFIEGRTQKIYRRMFSSRTEGHLPNNANRRMFAVGHLPKNVYRRILTEEHLLKDLHRVTYMPTQARPCCDLLLPLYRCHPLVPHDRNAAGRDDVLSPLHTKIHRHVLVDLLCILYLDTAGRDAVLSPLRTKIYRHASDALLCILHLGATCMDDVVSALMS